MVFLLLSLKCNTQKYIPELKVFLFTITFEFTALTSLVIFWPLMLNKFTDVTKLLIGFSNLIIILSASE